VTCFSSHTTLLVNLKVSGEEQLHITFLKHYESAGNKDKNVNLTLFTSSRFTGEQNYSLSNSER